MWSQRIDASSECSQQFDSITRINVFVAKLVCTKIYLTEQTCTICNDVFKDFLKHVLFDCNINRAYVHHVKLYYFVNIEMQVGVPLIC